MSNQTTAFVLHFRPYREKSALVDFISASYGRFSGVVHPKKGCIIQPFITYQIHWKGNASLKTITSVEINGPVYRFIGEKLYCALYLNELLQRTLGENCPFEYLVEDYQCALAQLQQQADVIPILRRFEFLLLQALGYGIDFQRNAVDGIGILSGETYLFIPEQGFVPAAKNKSDGQIFCTGIQIQALAQGLFTQPDVRQLAKSITRLALSTHLGNKPLKTRELFFSLYRRKRS